MHTTKAPAKGCLIISRDGVVARFDDFADLFHALDDAFGVKGMGGRWILERMRAAGYADAFSTEAGLDRDGRTVLRRVGAYRLATTDGEAITLDAVGAESLRRWREARAKPRHAGHAFRDGPVPGVRSHRGGGGWMRSMRTAQERREARSHDDEIVGHGRPASSARRVRDVPTSWDDVARRKERCWKSQRKHRWRRIAAP